MTLAEACVAGAVSTMNAGGRALDRVGLEIPKLDPASLMRAARERAGLESFGTWPIAEPLERLMHSYRTEAHLTMLGRVTVRELIVSLLENLLCLEAERRGAPQIEAQRIDAPTFIIGLPRTGTSLLHSLMGEDRANRVPLTWEVMFPAGYARSTAEDARVHRRAESRLTWANRLAPEFKRIHSIAPDLPQECIAITAQVFMSIQFHTTHNVPSYENWFESHPQDLGYQFHHRLLQHLQARRPGSRWVLKAPGHLFDLAALLRRYPDARIIQTHRDPLRVVASMASHATVLRRAFSDRANPREIAADWTARWANALESFLAAREHANPGQFLDVRYETIESEPVETIERVYEFLGWRLTDTARTAMTAFLAANPKNKHGVHRYSLAQYGLDKNTERKRFARYCERFSIPMPVD
jgi:Sulfotransferase family